MPVPEALRQPRHDNPSSWRWVVAFFEGVTARANGTHCLPLLRLARQLADSPIAYSFRAGQSLYDLLISTKGENGLDYTDPFVSVSAHVKSPLFRVDYWYGNKVGDFLKVCLCTEAELEETLWPLLERLRHDTTGPGERAV